MLISFNLLSDRLAFSATENSLLTVAGLLPQILPRVLCEHRQNELTTHFQCRIDVGIKYSNFYSICPLEYYFIKFADIFALTQTFLLPGDFNAQSMDMVRLSFVFLSASLLLLCDNNSAVAGQNTVTYTAKLGKQFTLALTCTFF